MAARYGHQTGIYQIAAGVAGLAVVSAASTSGIIHPPPFDGQQGGERLERDSD